MNKKNKIIFLCTGNICRSPIGEALLKHAINALPKNSKLHGLEIVSAGTSTVDGMLPSANSITALEKVGIDINKYRSSRLTPEMIDECFALFAMSRGHMDIVRRNFTNPPQRMFTVNEMNPEASYADIGDPYGCALGEYLDVRDEIMSAIPFIVKYLENELEKA